MNKYKHLNMQGKGKIEWCDWSWNPQTGCRHNCEYCYMMRMRGYDMTPKFHPERLGALKALPGKQKIFICSSADLFGEWVTKEDIQAVLDDIKEVEHTCTFLTKNPKRYLEFEFPENAWIGTTLDTQKRADTNLDFLKRTSAAVKFVSFEPLLEEINADLTGIDWIIIGARTGAPFDYPLEEAHKWAEKIIIQARQKQIPIFLKTNLRYPKRIAEYPSFKRG